ncbi:hypothetical protein Q7L71_09545 [Conexibacter sp. CPCC 205706]|nr:hypothetical protein [Conexibacter sp. CPCC 205706]MDO8185823.1 hypothetical protein [Conexibacter sp. CPCC 205706]MDO8198567.1 hypothetical protein [Conexibacter sp. CPCC 205762]
MVVITPEREDTANAFYDRWHRLRRCERPFRVDNFGLRVNNELVAIATSASTVSRTVTDTIMRTNTVELARIASTPRHRHSTRALLRLYRMFLAQTWPCWPIDAVISYGLAGARGGQMYKFDGWTFLRTCPRSGGGGTYSRPSAANQFGDGKKSLWGWSYSDVPLHTHDWRHAPKQQRQRAAAQPATDRTCVSRDSQLLLL